MRHSFYFFFFTFCLTLLFQAIVGDIVDDSCKKISQANPTVTLDFGVKSLGEDPKSHTADLEELALISVNLLIANANQIGEQIKKLLEDSTVASNVKECLNICQQLYFSAATYDAQEAITYFKSKDYESANIAISGMTASSLDCEDGFKEWKFLVSPLTEVNNHFVGLCGIALGFTNI